MSYELSLAGAEQDVAMQRFPSGKIPLGGEWLPYYEWMPVSQMGGVHIDVPALPRLAPPACSRPAPFEWRDSISCASRGWFVTSARPRSFSHQRNAGMSTVERYAEVLGYKVQYHLIPVEEADDLDAVVVHPPTAG